MIEHPITAAVLKAGVAAAILGTTGTVATNWYTNGQQDVRLEQTENIGDQLDRIETSLTEVQKDVEYLAKEQDRMRDEDDE